jgi:hypothetical protein
MSKETILFLETARSLREEVEVLVLGFAFFMNAVQVLIL